MTRKGKVPISVPTGVEVKVEKDMISIKGPKGVLTQALLNGVHAKLDNGKLLVSQEEGVTERSNYHGLYHTLLQNMVIGTTKGFEKRLEMIGVGYRAALQGKNLSLQVGFSHPTLIPIPTGIDVKVDKNTLIIINGIDKQLVGQFASTIRAIRPPEPYQGKGIRYQGEYVRKKAGKSAAKK